MQHVANAPRPRPRPLPEIFEAAARIYRERALDLYAVAFVALTVSWTVNLLIKIWTLGGMSLGALEDPRAPEFFRRVGQVFVAGVANGMVYALLNSVAGAVLTVFVAETERGRRPTLAEGLREAAPRFVPVLGATLLYFLAIAALIGLAGAAVSVTAAGGLLTGLAGGIVGILVGVAVGLAALGVLLVFGLTILYLSLRWALYPQVAVLEGAGPLDALRASVRMTREAPRTPFVERYLFRAAVLLFALVLLQVVVGAVGGVPEYGVGLWFGRAADHAAVSVLNPTGMPLYILIPLEMFSVILSAAVFPFGVALFTLLYFDVSGRRRAARETARADARIKGPVG